MLTTTNKREKLVDLFRQGTRLSYKKGEFVVRPGELPPGVFYIVTGLVKAYDITKYGEENLIIMRKKGEILGLTWTLTGENRNIIYATVEPAVLMQVSHKQFMDFLRSSPQAALQLVDVLADMYRLHSERILNLTYRSVRERLISFLLTAAKRFGKPSESGILIDMPLRHQDIASSISATRETASRELAILERLGLITRDTPSSICLTDADKLRSYLE